MVYLVDDDADDLEILQQALFHHSYKGPVRIAENGQILLDYLTSQGLHERDIILMDLNMPLKNGFITLGEMKTIPTLKNIPVIILTSSSNKADEAKCFELGCSYFYTKPSSFEGYSSIVQTVKKFLENSPG